MSRKRGASHSSIENPLLISCTVNHLNDPHLLFVDYSFQGAIVVALGALFEVVREWCFPVSTAFLFYFHVVLTGVAIAAASTYFAALVGAPAPKMFPVVGENGGIAGAVALWLLTGPIALMRFVVRAVFRHNAMSFMSMGILISALIWVFCLGVVVLELIFRLFVA